MGGNNRGTKGGDMCAEWVPELCARTRLDACAPDVGLVGQLKRLLALPVGGRELAQQLPVVRVKPLGVVLAGSKQQQQQPGSKRVG